MEMGGVACRVSGGACREERVAGIVPGAVSEAPLTKPFPARAGDGLLCVFPVPARIPLRLDRPGAGAALCVVSSMFRQLFNA